MVTEGFIAPGDWDVNILLFPEHYRIQLLPDKYKSQLYASYTDIICWLEQFPNTGRAIAGYNAAIAAVKNAPPAPISQLEKFRELTAKIDALRGQNFATTFKEYVI